MDEKNMETDQRMISFCRKCGNRLHVGAVACEQCGTTILNISPESQEKTPLNNEEIEASKAKPKTSKRKKFLLIVTTTFLVAILVLASLFVSKSMVTPQDINTINGCPEFYNIEFGMSSTEASKNIELKHKIIEGIKENHVFEINDSTKNDGILIDEEEVFFLYGKETSYVHIGFDIDEIDSVIFEFSPEKYNLNNIISLYKRIYGNPTTLESTYATWSGPKTTIDIFEYTSEYDNENSIVVRYVITPNSQYTSLSFDGTELDPCGFLSNNNPFDKNPEFFIKGLKEDVDYEKQVFSPEGFDGFTKYTLYPSFDYMGIDEGCTAIEFDIGSDKNNIEIASYVFLLSQNNVIDRFKYIYSSLTQKYGTTKDSTYPYDETISKIENAAYGMYRMQWESKGKIITLALNINKDKEYYEGNISYSENG